MMGQPVTFRPRALGATSAVVRSRVRGARVCYGR